MKLYRITTLHGSFCWAGTQADAKRIVKDEHVAGYEDVEVPTDKPNLLNWLNSNCSGGAAAPTAGPVEGPTSTHGRQPDALEAAELRAVAAARGNAVEQERRLTTDSIVSFILDDATVAQAEAVFAALGARFKECVNVAR